MAKVNLIINVVFFSFSFIINVVIIVFDSKGTYLLTGALCLHTIPAALLFRPISYFRSSRRIRQVQTRQSIDEKNTALVCPAAEVEVSMINEKHVDTRNMCNEATYESPMCKVDEQQYSKSSAKYANSHGPLQHAAKETRSDTENGGLIAEAIKEDSFQSENCNESLLCNQSGDRDDALYVKCIDTDTKGQILCDNKQSVMGIRESTESAHKQQKCVDGIRANQTSDSDSLLDSKTPKSCSKAVVTKPRSGVQFPLDFSLFRRPIFRLLFSCFFLFPVVNVTVAYLPVVARENNVSETHVANLLSIIGALDLVSRLGSGVIADRKLLRVSTMIVISFFTLGVTYQCVRFLTSFETFVVLAVIQGLLGSVVNCLIPVLIVDHVGLENMAKGIGFYQVAAGSFIAVVNPLLGEYFLSLPCQNSRAVGTKFCQRIVSKRGLANHK